MPWQLPELPQLPDRPRHDVGAKHGGRDRHFFCSGGTTGIAVAEFGIRPRKPTTRLQRPSSTTKKTTLPPPRSKCTNRPGRAARPSAAAGRCGR